MKCFLICCNLQECLWDKFNCQTLSNLNVVVVVAVMEQWQRLCAVIKTLLGMGILYMWKDWLIIREVKNKCSLLQLYYNKSCFKLPLMKGILIIMSKKPSRFTESPHQHDRVNSNNSALVPPFQLKSSIVQLLEELSPDILFYI